MKVETVKVATDNEQGYFLLNKEDFDPAKQKLFGEKPKPKRKPRTPKSS